ncbi:hypothetical protein HMPREF2975_03995 [Actinomyces sp. HMSC065F12]|nr:hypothetical protein HMPREF2975_03995 [Actinomyces sp. HMSC065F12]
MVTGMNMCHIEAYQGRGCRFRRGIPSSMRGQHTQWCTVVDVHDIRGAVISVGSQRQLTSVTLVDEGTKE